MQAWPKCKCKWVNYPGSPQDQFASWCRLNRPKLWKKILSGWFMYFVTRLSRRNIFPIWQSTYWETVIKDFGVVLWLQCLYICAQVNKRLPSLIWPKMFGATTVDAFSSHSGQMPPLNVVASFGVNRVALLEKEYSILTRLQPLYYLSDSKVYLATT